MKLIYFGIEYAVKVHDAILEKSGGMAGTLDLGRLESVLYHIQNDDYYPGFECDKGRIWFSRSIKGIVFRTETNELRLP